MSDCKGLICKWQCNKKAQRYRPTGIEQINQQTKTKWRNPKQKEYCGEAYFATTIENYFCEDQTICCYRKGVGIRNTRQRVGVGGCQGEGGNDPDTHCEKNDADS